VRNGKIHVELLGKFGSSEELDQSNLKFDRSNFAQSRSIEISQNTQSGVSPRQKAVLPLIFAVEHVGCMTLVVSSKRGTLERVRGVILHGFLALISFYKSHNHTSLLSEFREQ
jgi:hypothetical protein